MKKILAILLSLTMLLVFFAACGEKNKGTEDDNDPDDNNKPVVEESPEFSSINYDADLYYKNYGAPVMGDPFCYYDEETGVFYLYGTTRKAADGTIDPKENFKYYTSTDMVNWQYGGICFQPKPTDWSQNRLWAPEMYKIGDKYYLYYTAAASSSAPLHGSVAVADSPAGPFTNNITAGVDGSAPRFSFAFPTIDGSIFIDGDEMYYYFAKDQVMGISTIWGVKLSNPYTVEGDPVQLTDVGYSYVGEKGNYTQSWEVANASAKWNEGPFVLKHDGTYYLTYSANYFGDKYYSVGYATSSDPLSGFVKPQNAQIMGLEPVSEKAYEWDYFSGSGHHMFMSVGEENFIVYHKHVRPGDTSVRIASFDRYGFRDDGSLYINGPTLAPQPLPAVVSGYSNVAAYATPTADGGSGDLYCLLDGAIGVYKKYAQYEYQLQSGKNTLTFTFARERNIKAVMIYNSADYDKAFDSVASVTFNDKYTFQNLATDAAMKNPYRKYMLAGGSAAVTLTEPFKTKTVTITFESEKPVSLSEVVILGE